MMYQGGGCNGARPRTMTRQWKTLCRPMMEYYYASELWEGEISLKYCSSIETIQNKFGRATLGLRTMPASVAVLAELGLETMQS